MKKTLIFVIFLMWLIVSAIMTTGAVIKFKAIETEISDLREENVLIRRLMMKMLQPNFENQEAEETSYPRNVTKTDI